ncbi:MAG: tungsten ABC transporter substrate-binding protein, partial [Planctomycetes bacterium]|nr:tungsten ABC transporter substrate-binding protein [Planctomycetota bacterium]
MQKYLFSLIFIFGLALTSCGESDRPTQRLKITTTTSVDNSGLLNILLPAFEKEVNYRVDIIAVGTGKALKLAKNGDIDAVIVH